MTVLKPPMGFNTWNTFGRAINDKLIMETADAMAESGLKELGYEYVVIDDCWSEKRRDVDGRLVPSRDKFPNGIKPVADYVHSKGLKFGIYSCVGTMTCGGYPGSYGHEYLDAATFAEWGVDFLKYDYCYRPKTSRGEDLYRKMALALKSSGRDILFSACSWGHDGTDEWIDTTGANMWRAMGDIKDSWQYIKNLSEKCVFMRCVNRINCFTDLDMLIVGMKGKGFCAITGCSFEEYKTHFSFWAMMGSPLMISCDIREMDEETRAILFNKEIIAVNQDSELNRPYLLHSSDHEGHDVDGTYVFAKILENGDIALGFFNYSDNKIGRFVTESMLGLDADIPLEYTVHDLWSGEEVKPINGTVLADIEPHGCRMFRVKIHKQEKRQ